MDERLATIRIKAKFFLYMPNLYARSEDKKDDVKAEFYARLETIYYRCPTNDVKILLGDFNAKIGQECIFHPILCPMSGSRKLSS